MKLHELTIIAAGMTLWGGCGSPTSAPEDRARYRAAAKQQAPARAYKYKVKINLPHSFLGLNTGKRDARGEPVRVPCATCHRLLKPNPQNRLSSKLEAFHRGVKLQHGKLTCATCHNPPRYDSFRLGSGASLPYGQVMELCGQCHSRQHKDYQLGIHGGMAGHWDLDSGGRDRNHCLDCHNPHRPAHDRLIPAPRPRYRFLDSGKKGGGHE